MLRKRRLYPADGLLKVLPQRCRVLVVLMLRHVLIDLIIRAPRDGRFQVLLPDWASPHVVARQPIGRATRLAEISLGVRSPGPGIYGVAQFLIGVFFACNVDSSKPIQLLAVRPGAEIDHELVTENLLLLIVFQVVERQPVDGKIAVDILADGKRALLAIDDLVITVLAHRPIHHVQRKVLSDAIDHRIALLVLVDKFPLIRRANVELAAVGNDALLSVVREAVG